MIDKIDEICAITESNNSEFPRTKLAIATFIQHNNWFNGRIIVLTLKSDPLTDHNIKLLGQYYNDIEIREVDDLINDDKLSDSDKLDYLRIYAFNIKSEGNIYFSRRSIFLKNISDSLNNQSISTFELGNSKSREILFNFDEIDSDFMFIPHSYISNNVVSIDSYSDINIAINSYIKLYEFNIQKDIIIMKASEYPDNKYSEFIRYHKHSHILIMNTISSSLYNRITLYWISLNKKINDIKPSKVKLSQQVRVIPKLIVNESDFRISVIIPAYKASEYIEDCIESILKQTTTATIEILIGIDNCYSTLSKIEEIKHKYQNIKVFLSEKSVGPYIIRNSLLRYANYEYILFFDADDIMKPNMISTILAYNSKINTIRFKYLNFKDENGVSINYPHHDVAHGVFFSHRDIINRTGGFMPWICGADTEFMKRLANNKISEIIINEYLFYRRIHNNSLTQNATTNHRSKVRDDAKRYIKFNKNWAIPINTQITDLRNI